jgi:hypothetical protein
LLGNGVTKCSQPATARRQRREIGGARDADIDRRLLCLLPGDARRRVTTLGDIDQLDERIDLIGVDVCR